MRDRALWSVETVLVISDPYDMHDILRMTLSESVSECSGGKSLPSPQILSMESSLIKDSADFLKMLWNRDSVIIKRNPQVIFCQAVFGRFLM